MARIHEHTVNIAAPLSLVNAIPLAMQGDSEADELKLHVLRGREPADMSGYTVGGYLERADGIRVVLNGSVKMDVVEVKLQEACYRVPGAYKAFVRLSKSTGEKMTLFLFAGWIENEGDGDIVDDESKIPSIEELVAMIEEIDRATSGANEARDNANAAAEEARTAVEEMRAAIENESSEQVQAIKNAGAGQVSTVQEAGAGQVQVVNAAGAAQQDAIQQKGEQTLATIPEEYTVLDADVKSLKDQKANVIIDTSAKAASHSLHAQDGRMHVTLYGKTTETGTGDKSPDNPYTISGVNAAQVHAGGKNLFKPEAKVSNSYGVKMTIDEDAGNITIVGTSTASAGRTYLNTNGFYLAPGTYTASIETGATEIPCLFVQYKERAVSLGNANWGKAMTFKVTKNEPVQVAFNLKNGAVYDVAMKVQIESGETATAYEPYNANVITPALLPDGAPLMGNGTVDDTVENDVLIGCDKGRWLTGANTENWAKSASGVFGLALNDYNTGNLAYSSTHYTVSSTPITGNQMYWMNVYYGNRIAFASTLATVEEWRAHLAANPIYLAYRSTEYTPDKDLRVCKVVRKYDAFEFAGPFWDVKTGAGGTPVYIGDLNTNGKGILREGFSESFNFKPGGWGQLSKGDGQWLHTNHIGVCWNFASIDEANAWVSENPLRIVAGLTTPETYMTDPMPLRKPSGIMPVTVTGSGETAVTYPHDTKHYIDQKFDALAAALLS